MIAILHETGKEQDMETKAIIQREQWQVWLDEEWSLLPYVQEFALPRSGLPLSWEKAWQESSSYSFVLESGKGGRYTYLGLHPSSIIEGQGAAATWTDFPSNMQGQLNGKPLDVVQAWMESYRSPRVGDLPFFTGGAVGYFSYDIVRSLERLPVQASNDTQMPDYLWMRMNELWIYDHEQTKLYCAVHVPNPADLSQNDLTSHELEDRLLKLYEEARCHTEDMFIQWQTIVKSAEGDINYDLRREQLHDDVLWPARDENEGWTTPFTQEDFQNAVLRIQDYIRQGDVFQVNLSVRQQRSLAACPEDVYEWLRLINPSPYMGMLRSPGLQLISGSPELLVKLDNECVSARPIAGTRRRGYTAAEDEAMVAELLASEKEQAEHIMLVDLERNDIGRVADYGSVHVPELKTVEYYSHVMHLVSQVEGKLAKGLTAFDVIAAVFPGGTITGAPKVRTMEIIEELEPVRRGPYTGSMGWIDYNGNMELNIIIRTIAVKERIAYIQAGAGIVIDSDPYREYRECRNKARAVMKAVQCCEEEAAFMKAGITGGRTHDSGHR